MKKYGLVPAAMFVLTAVACGEGPVGLGSIAPSANAPDAVGPAKLLERDMIVVLRDQLTSLIVDRPSTRVRAAAIRAAHEPLIAELHARKPRKVRRFETVNGFAARMSQDEIDAFSAKPEVLAVVPDRVIRAHRRSKFAGIQASVARRVASGADPSNLCNTLEPEALQITNAAFLDPTVPQAQTVLDGNGEPVTGKGVTVAVIGDGLDPNIPGFTRPDGTNVFVDYHDFTDDPAGTPTGGGEIYGDASSVAAQDMPNGQPLLFDIDNFWLATLPSPCNIRLRGMAPGASLVGLQTLSYQDYGNLSNAVLAIDWAVVHDQVDVINQSFDGQYVADADTDPLSLADAAAVRAGVTVTIAAGDEGPAGFLGSPATVPDVIQVGAATQFRFYAQTGYAMGGFFSSWVSGGMSGLSAGGFGQAAPRTIDIVAPGDLGWELCDANTAIYTQCTTYNGAPSNFSGFGGTSEAAPLTAGAAALVIQAYRSTHHGVSPSPALVKAILMSSATDLASPVSEQGAGRLDALAAVHTALSIRTPDGGSRGSGGAPVVTPSSAALTGYPRQLITTAFQITNTGASTAHLTPSLERLGPPVAGQTLSLSLPPNSAPGLPASTQNAIMQTLTIPAGVDHLDASIGFAQGKLVELGLLDPEGRLIAFSSGFGNNSAYGHLDVGKPAPGVYTAVLYGDGGPVVFTWTAENYISFGTVFPPTLDLKPGASAPIAVAFRAPDQPGDLAAAVRFRGSAIASVPVGVRVLVPLGPTGGSFTGTLTGDDGIFQGLSTQTYLFDVPSGVGHMGVTLTTADAGYLISGVLIAPDGAVLDSSSNNSPVVAGELAVDLQRAAPAPGRWKLLVQENDAAGNATSTLFTAAIVLGEQHAFAHGLPSSPLTRVSAAQGVTATVSVTNTAAVTKQFFVDARSAALTSRALTVVAPCAATLPGYCSFAIVPPRTVQAQFAAQVSLPIIMDAAPSIGAFYTEDPDVFARPVGDGTFVAVAALSELPFGAWIMSPHLSGVFGPAGAPATPITTAATVVLQDFDASASASSGNYWADATLGTSTFVPVVVAPGATGTIAVTLQPPASNIGQVVRGVLYIEAINPADQWASGDELAALRYTYTIAP